MTAPAPTFYFDFVDPLSYLLELELETAPGAAGLRRAPFELRPPPSPLIGIDDESLADRWSTARNLAAERGLTLAPPRLVPWSRKAHELHILAGEHGVDEAVRRAIYEAYLTEERDIGRVDVLVDIGRAAGLDRTRTKAVLDVDRHDGEVARIRGIAEEMGVTTPPVIVSGGGRLQGFHNRSALGTFLRDTSGPD